MNVITQALSLIETENYQAVMSLLEENSSESLNSPDYYWLYGLALFAEGLEEEAQGVWLEGLLSQGYAETAIESLIGHLIQYVYRQQQKPPLLSIQKIYQTSSIIAELNEDYYKLNYLPSLQIYFDQVKKEALSLAISGDKAQAQAVCEILISLSLNDPDIYYRLGLIYFQSNQSDVALNLLNKAIELDSENYLYFYSAGLVHEKQKRREEAILMYNYALQKNDSHADTYANLGNILTEIGDLESAESLYRNAIQCNVEHFGIFINYGNLLLKKGQLDESILMYEKAKKKFPIHPATYYNLALAYENKNQLKESEINKARALFYEGKDDEAFILFDKYLLSDGSEWDYWNEVNSYYYSMIGSKYKKLVETSQEGIKRFPDSVKQRFYYVASLMRFHKYQEAKNFALSCVEYFKNEPEKSLIFKLLCQSTIPMIHDSYQDILDVRNSYHQELLDLENEINRLSGKDKAYVLFALDVRNTHYLHFHGMNDLVFQKLNAKIMTHIMEVYFKDYTKPLQLNSSNSNKVKVGYICSRSHSIGQLFLGWIKFHDREKVDVYFYDIGSIVNPQTEKFNIFSDHYCHCPWSIDDIAKKIRQDELDVLVFIDSVLEPRLYGLSFLRLAPIQCATWGHPVTTGSPEIDYFLGSDAMEPPNGQENYTENLIRLPNLGIYLNPIELPKTFSMKREDFGLPDNSILFISCQMLSKYLPQYDYLYPKIIQAVPNSKIVFFNAYESDYITETFKRRIKSVFDDYNISFDLSCIFMPLLKYEEYLNVLSISEVFLDTPGWSGCFTTMDSIACALPVVTLSGDLMRGRQTHGMLKIMDIEEMITDNESDYVELAVELGTNANFRKQMKQKIIQRRHKLYYDKSCVKALEKFYCEVVNVSPSER